MSGLLLVGADPAPMLAHDTGPGHPERPERLAAVHRALRARFPDPDRWLDAPPAPREALVRVHDERHVERVLATSGTRGWLDPDTPYGPRSAEAARLAAGCALEAVRAVRDGRAATAFAAVRPPGHHAERDRAQGFCLFNNAAVAIADALAREPSGRVLVVDWDVHHGNGVQHLFDDDPRVLHVDLHQHPLYPGTGRPEETGRGAGRGWSVNVALPAGRTDADYLEVFDALLTPAMERFAPGLVVVSAGFDAHRDDPLGGMRLTADGFAALAGRLVTWTRAAGARGPAAILEGGYDLAGLAGSAAAVAAVLDGEPAPDPAGRADAATRAAIEATRGAHRATSGPLGAAGRHDGRGETR
ncbi:MAG: histone deacetylase [Acidobacteria bacterium]|nr:MAG: histone deacetylase [Acidobacteriota bacterium]